jgi:hypothetical protein
MKLWGDDFSNTLPMVWAQSNWSAKSSSWKILLEADWVGATVSFSVDATGLGRIS